MNDEYLKKLYSYLGSQDSEYHKRTTYDDFKSKMGSEDYSTKVHGYIKGIDSEFRSLEDFNSMLKKKSSNWGSTLGSGLSESQKTERKATKEIAKTKDLRNVADKGSEIFTGYPGKEKNQYEFSNGNWYELNPEVEKTIKKSKESYVPVGGLPMGGGMFINPSGEGQDFAKPGTSKNSLDAIKNVPKKRIIEDDARIKALNKHFGKNASLDADYETFGDYDNSPEKKDNKYRIKNNSWERLVPGATKWSPISNEGSISALNRRYGKNIEAKKDIVVKTKEIDPFLKVNSNFLAQSEESAQQTLEKNFKGMGFTFEQTGLGTDYITVTPNNGAKPMTFSFDEKSSDEAVKLQSYLRLNASAENEDDLSAVNRIKNNVSTREKKYDLSPLEKNNKYYDSEDYKNAFKELTFQQKREEIKRRRSENANLSASYGKGVLGDIYTSVFGEDEKYYKTEKDLKKFKDKLNNSEEYKIFLSEQKKYDEQQGQKYDKLHDEWVIAKQSGDKEAIKTVKAKIEGGYSKDLIGDNLTHMTGHQYDLQRSINDFNKRKEKLELDAKNGNLTQEQYNDAVEGLSSEAQRLDIAAKNVAATQKRMNALAGVYVAEKAKSGGFFGNFTNAFVVSVDELISSDGLSGKKQRQQDEIEIKSQDITPQQRQYYKDKGYNDEQIKNVFINNAQKNAIAANKRAIIETFGSDLTTEESKQNLGFVEQALVGVAASLPSMALSLIPVVGQAAAFGGMANMSYNAINEEMLNDTDFETTSEAERAVVAVPYALVMGALENVGLKNMTAGKAGVAGRFILSRVAKLIPKGASREIAENIINSEVKNIFAKGGIKIVRGTLAEFETGLYQAAALDYGLKALYNELDPLDLKLTSEGGVTGGSLTGGELFATPDTKAGVAMAILEGGVAEAIGGFAMSTVMTGAQGLINGKISLYNEEDLKFFEDFSSDQEFKKLIVSNLKTEMLNGTMTKGEAQSALNDIDLVEGVFNSIDENISDEAKIIAFNLINERNRLEKEIVGKDPALSKEKNDRIKDINDKLETLPLQVLIVNNIERATELETALKQKENKAGTVTIDGKKIPRVEAQAELDKINQKVLDAERKQEEDAIKASIPEEISSLKDDEPFTKTVKTLEEVPEEFRDRAKKSTSKGTITTREKILGLPIGKKITTEVDYGYTYTLTGKEAKDYAIQEQAAGQVPVQSTTTVGEEVVQGEPKAKPQGLTEEGKAEEINSFMETEKSFLKNNLSTAKKNLEDATSEEDRSYYEEAVNRREKELELFNSNPIEYVKSKLEEFSEKDENGELYTPFSYNMYKDMYDRLSSEATTEVKAEKVAPQTLLEELQLLAGEQDKAPKAPAVEAPKLEAPVIEAKAETNVVQEHQPRKPGYKNSIVKKEESTTKSGVTEYKTYAVDENGNEKLMSGGGIRTTVGELAAASQNSSLFYAEDENGDLTILKLDPNTRVLIQRTSEGNDSRGNYEQRTSVRLIDGAFEDGTIEGDFLTRKDIFSTPIYETNKTTTEATKTKGEPTSMRWDDIEEYDDAVIRAMKEIQYRKLNPLRDLGKRTTVAQKEEIKTIEAKIATAERILDKRANKIKREAQRVEKAEPIDKGTRVRGSDNNGNATEFSIIINEKKGTANVQLKKRKNVPLTRRASVEANLTIQTDENKKRFVTTKNKTKVYIDEAITPAKVETTKAKATTKAKVETDKLNSEEKQYALESGIPEEVKKIFTELKGTKATDDSGAPLLVYHGGVKFDDFNPSQNKEDKGIYFTDNEEFALYFAHQAELYERDKRGDDYSDIPEDLLETGEPFPEKYFKYAKVHKAYLDMKNPTIVDAIDAKSIPKNYQPNTDGFIAKSTGDFGYRGGQYVVFDPKQIKKVPEVSSKTQTDTTVNTTETAKEKADKAAAKEEAKSASVVKKEEAPAPAKKSTDNLMGVINSIKEEIDEINKDIAEAKKTAKDKILPIRDQIEDLDNSNKTKDEKETQKEFFQQDIEDIEKDLKKELYGIENETYKGLVGDLNKKIKQLKEEVKKIEDLDAKNPENKKTLLSYLDAAIKTLNGLNKLSYVKLDLGVTVGTLKLILKGIRAGVIAGNTISASIKAMASQYRGKHKNKKITIAEFTKEIEEYLRNTFVDQKTNEQDIQEARDKFVEIREAVRKAKLAIKTKSQESRKKAFDAIREMLKGKVNNLSAVQLNSIMLRLASFNALSQTQYDKFIDYVDKVIGIADYDAKVNEANKNRKTAKNNLPKLGDISSDLLDPLSRVLNINAKLIPSEVFESYSEIVEMLSKRDAILELNKRADLNESLDKIIESIESNEQRISDLKELYDNFAGKTADYAETLDEMLKVGIINQSEHKLMKTFKSKIQEPKVKDKMTEQEIADEKVELINEINNTTITLDEIVGDEFRLERDLVKKLQALLKNKKTLESLNNKDLKDLLRVIDNINNGFVSNATQEMVEKLNFIEKSILLESSIPETFKVIIARINQSLEKRISKRINVAPLFNIDQQLGDFKTKNIFNSVFNESAKAQQGYQSAITLIQDELDKIERGIATSFENEPNKIILSQFKMMVYMMQLEYDSNPNNNQVHQAMKTLDATITFAKQNSEKSGYNELDIAQMESIKKEFEKDGEIDIDKLYNSFNESEKNGLKKLQEINDRMTKFATYTATVINGNKIKPLKNYISYTVINESDILSASETTDQINNINANMDPGTVSKNLEERDGKLTLYT
jgi:hypothetical protein